MDRRGLLLATSALLLVRPAAAQGGLERLFGIYVGTARVEDGEGRPVEQREDPGEALEGERRPVSDRLRFPAPIRCFHPFRPHPDLPGRPAVRKASGIPL